MSCKRAHLAQEIVVPSTRDWTLGAQERLIGWYLVPNSPATPTVQPGGCRRLGLQGYGYTPVPRTKGNILGGIYSPFFFFFRFDFCFLVMLKDTWISWFDFFSVVKTDSLIISALSHWSFLCSLSETVREAFPVLCSRYFLMISSYIVLCMCESHLLSLSLLSLQLYHDLSPLRTMFLFVDFKSVS